MPPSSESEIWTLVSFVMRERVAVRRGAAMVALRSSVRWFDKEGWSGV